MWALPRRGTHKKNLLSIKVDISGVYSFNCNVFDLVFVAKSIFEVRKYGFVAHMLTWPTRVRGTLHIHRKALYVQKDGDDNHAYASHWEPDNSTLVDGSSARECLLQSPSEAALS